MGAMASQITSLKIVYSTVYSSADQRIHLSSASLAFLRGIHRWPVNSPHTGPVTQKWWRHHGVKCHYGMPMQSYASRQAFSIYLIFHHVHALFMHLILPVRWNVTIYVVAGCFSIYVYIFRCVCYLIRWWYSFVKHIRGMRLKYTKPKMLRTMYCGLSWQCLTVHGPTTLTLEGDLQCPSLPKSPEISASFFQGMILSKLFPMDVRNFCNCVYVDHD